MFCPRFLAAAIAPAACSLVYHGGFSSHPAKMTITIYHNPRCSKSREAHAMAERFAKEHDIPLQVIEYLKTPPTRDQLQELRKMLGGDLRAMIRNNEDEYATLELDKAGEEALLDAVAAHPKLLQRPVVVYRGKAVIARPPELLQDFLGD